MKKSIFFTLILFSFFACKKQFDAKDIPKCVQEKIEEHKKESYNAEILTTINKGERVFWFRDDFADSGENIINDKCEVVCIVDFYGVQTLKFSNCPCKKIEDWEIIWKR
jgi:hypothetical protein